jgi:hypothetical protein
MHSSPSQITSQGADRLIENAELALQRCHLSGSQWGVQYWSTVLNTLLHSYNRLN